MTARWQQFREDRRVRELARRRRHLGYAVRQHHMAQFRQQARAEAQDAPVRQHWLLTAAVLVLAPLAVALVMLAGLVLFAVLGGSG